MGLEARLYFYIRLPFSQHVFLVVKKKLSDIKVDLRSIEEIHRHLADSIQSGLITVDEKGNITFFNQAAIKILGQKIVNGMEILR